MLGLKEREEACIECAEVTALFLKFLLAGNKSAVCLTLQSAGLGVVFRAIEFILMSVEAKQAVFNIGVDNLSPCDQAAAFLAGVLVDALTDPARTYEPYKVLMEISNMLEEGKVGEYLEKGRVAIKPSVKKERDGFLDITSVSVFIRNMGLDDLKG